MVQRLIDSCVLLQYKLVRLWNFGAVKSTAKNLPKRERERKFTQRGEGAEGWKLNIVKLLRVEENFQGEKGRKITVPKFARNWEGKKIDEEGSRFGGIEIK